MYRLGILGSTRGTSLVPILDAIQNKLLDVRIEIVISNKCDAKILEKAKNANIETKFLDAKNLDRETYDQKLSYILEKAQVHLIVLIGYMRILSEDFVRRFENKIINVHPSLLPAFAGLMNEDVHQAVLSAKVALTGCTVHYVTEKVDQGPIVLQKTCPVFPEDTVQQLKERVQTLEGVALIEAIQKVKHAYSY